MIILILIIISQYTKITLIKTKQLLLLELYIFKTQGWGFKDNIA